MLDEIDRIDLGNLLLYIFPSLSLKLLFTVAIVATLCNIVNSRPMAVAYFCFACLIYELLKWPDQTPILKQRKKRQRGHLLCLALSRR